MLFVHEIEQQSLSFWQLSPLSAHPQIWFTHCCEQQVEGSLQLLPSSVQDGCEVAHVDVFVSHTSVPQQSPSLPQPAPTSAQPQLPLTQRSEQHSDGSAQEVPSTLQLFTQVLLPGSHRSVPQQSALDSQVSPVPRQPQVLLVGSHRRAPQQSALLEQALPLWAQAQVLLLGSHRSAPQQSALVLHVWEERAQPQVWFTHWDEQQSDADAQVRPSARQAPPSLVPPSPPPPPPQVKLV